MSNVQKFSNVSQQNKEAGDGDSMPQSLKEALELMDSINRRLEDCAMEWQSKISKQQWKLLNDKSATEVAWDQSLLALQNQISEVPSARSEKSNPVVAPLDLSLLEDKTGQQSERRRSKRLAALNSSRDVQQCFAELIKAKIDLDTKFLGFEAVLNGPNSITMPPTESVSCLCQICSNILGTVIDNEKMLKDVTKPKVRKTSARPTSKRLVKSSRIWKKTHDRKQSLSLGHIDGKSVSPKSTKEC
ncbi:Protein of unknown function [Cotesia congregata]|uniref:Uncharacterized protein n=1 Tax=Cotesia congregata TaxID=51543 RepID=A0A8J2HKP3_COTCN|nr:Protein of unknown function [Cotesia congregata]